MAELNFVSSLDRRTFLRIISFTGLSGLIFPKHLLSQFMNLASSRVIIVEDESATDGNRINSDVVQVMMDTGIKSLAQHSTIGEAWKALLPNIDTTKSIAIKVNCINSSLSTHPIVVDAVVNGLQQMQFENISFPVNNIIIYDRTTNELRNAGYTINASEAGVRCFGTNSSGVGYTSERYNVNGSQQRISRIVTDMTDYLINVSVLKSHSMSGVTFCLKNHYGTINNPGGLHGRDDTCDPYIPALNALDPVISKQTVNICDALYGIRYGGPHGAPQFIANKLVMSSDIVAHDYNCRKILEDKGSNNLARSHHIDTAASATYNLGIADPLQMDIVPIQNPTTNVSVEQDNSFAPQDYAIQQNYPNPFNSQTNIRFYLSKPGHAKLTIFNSSGQYVRSLLNNSFNAGWNQVAWDGTADSGKQVASGIYVCQLQVDNYMKAIMMQYVR